MEFLLQKNKKLHDEITKLRYNHRPTLPIYNWGDMPQDVIEGQTAITTDGCFAWYQGGLWHKNCGAGSIEPTVPTPDIFIAGTASYPDDVVIASGGGGVTDTIPITNTVAANKYIIVFAYSNTTSLYDTGFPIEFNAATLFNTISHPSLQFDSTSGNRFFLRNILGNSDTNGAFGTDDNPQLTSSSIIKCTSALNAGQHLTISLNESSVGSGYGLDTQIGTRGYVVLGLNSLVTGISPDLSSSSGVGEGFMGISGQSLWYSDFHYNIASSNLSLYNSATVNDFMYIFGIMLSGQSNELGSDMPGDVLDFSTTRVKKITSFVVTPTDPAETENIVYICYRTRPASLSLEGFDITVPWDVSAPDSVVGHGGGATIAVDGTPSWAANGSAMILNTVT